MLDPILNHPNATGQENAFFFSSSRTSQHLAFLKNMVGRSSDVIVVTGENGCGKTTLMNQFVANADIPWQTGRIRLKSRHGLSTRMWGHLNDRKLYVTKEKPQPSVIIDDAHQLSAQEIKTLLRWAFFSSGGRKLQSILLLADERMRARYEEMAACLPPHWVIDKIHMAPLTAKQTAAYLEHCFRVAGLSSAPSLSENQIRAIHKKSNGLPGLINREADTLLKEMKRSPLIRSTSRRWARLLGIKEIGWSKRLGIQNLKRALNLEPTPWAP